MPEVQDDIKKLEKKNVYVDEPAVKKFLKKTHGKEIDDWHTFTVKLGKFRNLMKNWVKNFRAEIYKINMYDNLNIKPQELLKDLSKMNIENEKAFKE